MSTWLRAPVRMDREFSPPTSLRAVRAAKDRGFERLVFEYGGGTPPGYRVQLTDTPPATCGKGDPATVPGPKWLFVHLGPAEGRAVGTAPIPGAQLRRLSILHGLEKLCDFEGAVDWAVGVKGNPTFRVLELQRPSRLVIDLRDLRDLRGRP